MFFYQFSLKGHLLCYRLFGIYGSLILSRKLSEPYLKECHCSYLFGLEFKMICFLLDVKSFKCVFQGIYLATFKATICFMGVKNILLRVEGLIMRPFLQSEDFIPNFWVQLKHGTNFFLFKWGVNRLGS